MRSNGSILGQTNRSTSSRAKGVWDIRQQHLARAAGIWPLAPVAFGSASRDFDGTNDRITFTAPQFSASNAISIAFWAKVGDANALGGIFSPAASAVGDLVAFHNRAAGTIQFGTPSSGTPYINVPVTQNVWTHWVWVIRSTTDRQVYKNAVSGGTNTNSFTFSDQSNRAIELGRSESTYFLDGNLADFRIYDRAISLSEIELLEAGTHVQDDLVFWMLTDTDDVLDWSGSEKHGTNIESTYSTDGPLD